MAKLNDNKCRFCAKTSGELAASCGFLMKYGPRHHAHLGCLLEAKGRVWLESFLMQTPLWMINQIPYFEAKKLGLLPMLRATLGHGLEESPCAEKV